MELFKLSKNTFTRKYNDIMYIYNQLNRNDYIFDKIGAAFLQQIGRLPISIKKIIANLCLTFPNVSEEILENDFYQFIENLVKNKFIITGSSNKELIKNDVQFSYKNIFLKNNTKENANNNANQTDSKKYLDDFFTNFPKIFRAHIELTNLCNLKCIHCYIVQDDKKNKLSKEILFSFLDQLEKMGTLEVIFTGGEALLYKDLIQVLHYARKKDFTIILLTNGTLFNDEIINCIKEVNIAFVQISLYSMQSNIHDIITDVKGSWEKSIKSINKLIKKNIRVEIACPIIKENMNTFHQVIDYGNSIGVSVSNDLGIMAKEDFSRDNLNHRVDISKIKSIVKKRYQHELSTKKNTDLFQTCLPTDSVCGMGKSLICLSADGHLYPCPGFRISLGNIYENSLSNIWNKSIKIKNIRKITYSSFPKCINCEYLNYCSICPAKFYNESGGDIFKVDEYFCEITKSEKKIRESYSKE